MRKSWHEDNRKMLQAYQCFKLGSIEQSLLIYQSILQNTGNPSLKLNLTCTVSVLSSSLGHYNFALQNLQNVINQLQCEDSIVKIRSSINLIMIYIMMGKYNQAIFLSKQLFNFIKNQRNGLDLTQLSCRLLFRVNSLSQLKQDIQIKQNISLTQAYFLSHIAFGKDICSIQGSKQILKIIYSIFLNYQNYEMGICVLRQLVTFELCQEQLIYYQKQLTKLMSIGINQFQYDNSQAIDCCRQIAYLFVQLQNKVNKDQTKVKMVINWVMWRLVLTRQIKKVLNNNNISQQQKINIHHNFSLMLRQQNQMIVKEMVKSNFYINAQRQISNIIKQSNKILKKLKYIQLKYGFQKIMFHYNDNQICKENSSIVSHSKVSRISHHSQQPNESRLSQKTNKPKKSNKSKQNIGISIISSKQSNIKNSTVKTPRVSIFKQTKSISNVRISDKSISKMIKFCQYGSFLSKRNFNSDGGQFRFVRVTNSVIKWAKNTQQMQDGCQLYPLKDIKSILYGKMTPTLHKGCNNLLRQYFCFSLHLQKRTLDFYCNDYEQTCNWVCGLSEKLKTINPKISGYNKGKMRWRKMFMILRQNFTQKLKTHQKTYYYQNAYALILFKKNGYKLPK